MPPYRALVIRQSATLKSKALTAMGTKGVVRLLGPCGHLRSFSPFKLNSTAVHPSLAKTTGRISPSRRGPHCCRRELGCIASKRLFALGACSLLGKIRCQEPISGKLMEENRVRFMTPFRSPARTQAGAPCLNLLVRSIPMRDFLFRLDCVSCVLQMRASLILLAKC